MEPGTYATNTILINAITSIPYTYLEPISLKSASSLASLRRIEGSWRGEGALVVCDPSKFGLWIFGSGNGDDPYAKLSSSCVIDKDGDIEAHGVKFHAEARGTFETSALKSPDIFQAQGTSKLLSTANSSSLESVRSAQIINARAAQINNAASIKQGQLPSPVNAASSNTEAFDSTAKILQLFISAVLGSASYLLCHDHELIPMNARTLTRPSRRTMKDNVASMNYECPRLSVPMITLDVALTPLGNLTLKATCQASSALSFVTISKENEAVKSNVHAGELLLLAPGATMARYLGPCTEDSIMNFGAFWEFGQNTSSQTGKWKYYCRNWLADMGVNPSLLENCAWLMVQISTSNQPIHKLREISHLGPEPLAFPWPAELCFVRHKVAFECFGKTRTNMAFRNDIIDRDPLIFAEQWFSTKVERDANLSRRQQCRDAETAARVQAEIQAKVVASTIYSPIVARRNSTVGVYPTPPDGVQVMTGVTPNFDGTSSTPGNVNQPTPMTVDLLAPAKDDISNDLWSSAGAQKESQGSEFPTNDEGDLFGEITNDLFGENDITDADFNFFDEPDKILDVSVDSADNCAVSMMGQLESVDQHREGDIHDTVMVDAGEEHLVADPTDIEVSPTSPLKTIQTIPLSSDPARGSSPGEDHLHRQVLTVDEKHDIATILSPELVFKRLFPDQGQGTIRGIKNSSELPGQHRRFSQFGAIEFESAISAVNDKYSSHGRFGYIEKSELDLQPSITTIPETEYLNIRRKRRKIAPLISILTCPSPSTMLRIEVPSGTVAPVDIGDDAIPNSATGSDISDPDDLSPLSEEPPNDCIGGMKRKREIYDEDDYEIASSFQALAVDHATSNDIEEPMPAALDSDLADWPLNGFFNIPEPSMNYGSRLSDNEYIAAAQIITDQVASSTLATSSLIKGDAGSLSADFLDEKTFVNKAHKDLETVAKQCFHRVENCTLNKFLSIQGIPSINQIMRTQARPQVSMQLHNDNPFVLKTPYLEVRRSDSKLTVLPSAISFWDNLGLGPCKGNKDIRTVCIFPNGEAMPDNAAIFLERMRGAYESGKLGSHDKILSNELGFEQAIDHGLVSMNLPPLKNDQIVDQTILLSIKATCRRLGKALASLPSEERNLVVYFIYPSDHEAILPLICSGFYDLYEIYKRSLIGTRAKIRNELVLQLIPKRFVTSSTSIIMPSPADYARLALEVYDRCADFQSSSCSPSILLEQPLPERIDFKLTANPSVALLDENSCIHVAYAQSIDDRWISAAWTDNRGAEQMTASYCLGRKNRPISRTFFEIANEIWETTLDIISHKPVNWRIMLAKSGVMDRSEMDFWAGLASTESNASVTLTLLSVKPRPSLQLLPQAGPLSPITLSTQSGMLTTPVSTPQPLSILSPDTTTTPIRDRDLIANNAPTPDSTPIEPPPPDATLIDITDQSWGSILSHRLNNSNSLLDNNPALLSGYLIKRGGTHPEDTPILFEINIVGVSSEGHRNARAYEHLLREIMGMYRGLGTLARMRGVVDPVKDTRPWHVAAVEKAVKVLYTLM